MLFSTHFDIVIVGGGISGLFLAYKLCETKLNILLIEKGKSLGGRIVTIEKDGILYEAGAARFNETHTKLISLIKELELEDQITMLPKEIDYKLREYKTDNYPKVYYLLSIVKKTSENYEQKYLQNITFFNLLIEIFDYETAEFIKDSFGFDSEFLDLNADSALLMYKDDLFINKDYFGLKNGLSQIITNMENILKKKKNVKILKNNTLKKIHDDKIETSIDTYEYKNLILAIPYSNLKQLDEFKDFKLLDSVKPIQLLRIYAKYPKEEGNDEVWFHNIKRTTTNSYIRHIIPIDYKKGLIMISYTDGLNAKILADMYSNGEDVLIKEIHKEIKKLFNIEPPKPSGVYVHNWSNEYSGVHMWKAGSDMNDLYPKIMQPDKGKNIFICGEAFSKKQCWIEGALETSYDVLKKLKLDGIELKELKELKN